MKNSQIIIGTASWGSKINFNKSIDIGNSIIAMGLNHFDTAPNYGSGYSHYVLNQLGKRKNIFIDTKYGQNINLTPKEIAKRAYRFVNIKSFKQSLKHIKFSNVERNSENFWQIEKLEHALNSFNEELKYCKIKTFYLHSPPYGILNSKYLEKFCNFFYKKKILPGISQPNVEDLDLLITNYPNIKFQFSIESFWNLKDKIINKINNLSINGIFKRLKKDKILNNSIDKKFWENFIKFIEDNNEYKIVLGINSNKSIEKLKKIILNFNNIIK